VLISSAASRTSQARDCVVSKSDLLGWDRFTHRRSGGAKVAARHGRVEIEVRGGYEGQSHRTSPPGLVHRSEEEAGEMR
jgi:hypothetical protein